jgi:hypothetical protein
MTATFEFKVLACSVVMDRWNAVHAASFAAMRLHRDRLYLRAPLGFWGPAPGQVASTGSKLLGGKRLILDLMALGET